MADSNKITSSNFLPGKGKKPIPVYAEILNRLITGKNTISIDTISEKTSGNGVAIDGVTAKDGQVSPSSGTVTQLTAITTAVTLNQPSGVITTVSSTLAAGSNAAFTVTNSYVTASSVIILTPDDSATAGLAKLNVQNIAAGSFKVNITNVHSANAFNNVVKIHFLVM